MAGVTLSYECTFLHRKLIFVFFATQRDVLMVNWSETAFCTHRIARSENELETKWRCAPRQVSVFLAINRAGVAPWKMILRIFSTFITYSPTGCAAITSYFSSSQHRPRRVHLPPIVRCFFRKAGETASRLFHHLVAIFGGWSSSSSNPLFGKWRWLATIPAVSGHKRC